ncbi:ferredoxin [Mycobacterium camsae]|uniref:ferredoxin n=1 Tax=Mycobacterium gordonae TaxID=1778 RepID=UPI0019806D66|nr:ferredoxin [Mycobacterium gordonae]
MKVHVDQNVCASSGNCVMNAPEIFDQRDEDGVVVLVNPSPPADQAEATRKAAALCPALAIQIEE